MRRTGAAVIVVLGGLGTGVGGWHLPQPERPPIVAERKHDAVPDPIVVFERYIDAIGGRSRVEDLRTRRVKGRVSGPPLTGAGTLLIETAAPNRMRMVIDEPAGRKLSYWFDGARGWVRSDGRLGELKGTALNDLRNAAWFAGEADYEDKYRRLETNRREKFEGQDCHIIRAEDDQGVTNELAFSVASGLIVGGRSFVPAADGSTDVVRMTLTDYKEFGGVLYPTRIERWTEGDTGERSVFEYESVEVNIVLDPVFSPPEVGAGGD